MTNLQIAELLRNVAASYQLKDPQKYRFQAIAYERAATSVEHATSELKDLWDDGKLEEVPSIGLSISKHLDEIFKTGKSKHFEELMKDIPKEAFTLMALPKVGLKTALKMIQELSKSGLSLKIKEAQKILDKDKRLLLPYAEKVALEVTEWLKEGGNVEKVGTLGSLRRKAVTVGDIDIAVATKKPDLVIERFINYPKKQKIIEKGTKTASIVLPNNVQVDILLTEAKAYGNALQHFTGSKNHNIALREFSLKKGFSMNEFRILNKKINTSNYFDNEKDLYNFIGLDYIEPELREDTGEIEASLSNSLPKLIELKDIRGDLQIHSDFNIETSHDLGIDSMEKLVEKGRELGYEYIAFTEHNPSKSGHSHDGIIELLKKKQNYIREKEWPIKVFNSLEIDINKDGSLPVPDKGLETLDFALVSIHSSFDLSRDEQTKRILTALAYPKVKIFAHPTARKINEREGIELDWPKIFDFCIKNDKWLEINADPIRLDLPDTLVREAVKLGVKLTLGTDTHEVTMMDNIKYGVYVARRGWAEKKDIINTRSLKEFEEMLQSK